jgi:hypothetical protein
VCAIGVERLCVLTELVPTERERCTFRVHAQSNDGDSFKRNSSSSIFKNSFAQSPHFRLLFALLLCDLHPTNYHYDAKLFIHLHLRIESSLLLALTL